jgi:hypothetical protein
MARNTEARNSPRRASRLDFRRKLRSACVNPDSRQEHSRIVILEVGCMLHDVRAAEIVAALLERLDHRARDRISINVVGVALVGLGQVFVHKGATFPVSATSRMTICRGIKLR